MICYGCGEPGHIRPNCPNRIRRVKSPSHSSVIQVDGIIAGKAARNLRVDTGAEKTVVRHDFVPNKPIRVDTACLTLGEVPSLPDTGCPKLP